MLFIPIHQLASSAPNCCENQCESGLTIFIMIVAVSPSSSWDLLIKWPWDNTQTYSWAWIYLLVRAQGHEKISFVTIIFVSCQRYSRDILPITQDLLPCYPVTAFPPRAAKWQSISWKALLQTSTWCQFWKRTEVLRAKEIADLASDPSSRLLRTTFQCYGNIYKIGRASCRERVCQYV